MYNSSHTPASEGLVELSADSTPNSMPTKLLLGVAALTLGQAIQNGNGKLTQPAIVWLTIALVCAGLSVISQRRHLPSISSKELLAVLAIGLVWQIYQLLTGLPGIYISPSHLDELWFFRASMGLAGGVALLSLAPETWISTRVRRGLISLVFLITFGAGVGVIRASPSPFIDVYVFHQTSSEALLHGRNPYELTAPNIYGQMDYYGAELADGSNLTIGNPYPPLSIYWSWLGYFAAGDIRYSHLAAILLAGLLMVSLSAGRETLLAAYIFLFSPRNFFVLEQSWTEPLVVLLSVTVLWCALKRPAWMPVALGLLFASKQYMIFMAPLAILLIPPGARWRDRVQILGGAVGVAFLVTAPLAFADFPAFLWNVGLSQWYQVYRLDALSYAVIYTRALHQPPIQLLPLIILCFAFLLAWRYAWRSPAGFASALAFSLGLFFAFSKQAFCNYYFLVIGVMCSALAVVGAFRTPTRNLPYENEPATS